MTVMKMALWFRLLPPVCFALLGTAVASRAQTIGQTPPKELLQFVGEARQRGEKDNKIKQQALAVGWPAASVDQAIAADSASFEFTPSDRTLPPAGNPKPAAVPSFPQQYEYQIGSGDTLQISVWKEPEASVP